MAVLKSIASGNWLTASTWGLVDSTSYLNAETGSEILTTAFSGTRSQAFTPGAITVEGIAVKLSVRSGTTGTISVHLALNSTHVEVAGTLVTINVSDLPAAATADLNGGWIYFKFASPVTLSAATAYEVEATTSSASQVSLFRDSTADNIARALVTTTTQAPVAGDDMIVAGEYTGAGTSNTITVTMNETATTDYGAASTSLVTPALAICSKGVLTWGTTAATNYNLKLSGNLIVYADATMNMGTTGTPCPRDSTMKLNFDCGANVDFGLTIRNLGTWNAQGLSRTSGKNIYYCKLNTDEAVNSTSLGVDIDTGWLDNDEIVVASTTRTASQSEKGTLNGNAGASSLTVDGFAGAGGGLANAHEGTAPVQAEVILLTRNVSLFGASASLQSYVDIKATATVDIDWAEFYWLGSATTNKRGFETANTTGSFAMNYSSIHDMGVSSSMGFSYTATSGNGFTFSNNVIFSTVAISASLNISSATSATWTIDSNIVISNSGNPNPYNLSDVGGTLTNNIAVGGNTGFGLGESLGTIGTISGNTAHSGSAGIQITSSIAGTISSSTLYRCSSRGILTSLGYDTIIFDTLTIFGCSTGINFGSGAGRYIFINATINGDTTFSSSEGVGVFSTPTLIQEVIFINCDFGTVSGIKTAHTTGDISFSSQQTMVKMYLYNTKLSSSVEVASQNNLSPNSFVSSQKNDQTAGLHKTWKKYGTITIDTTTFRTASPAQTLTPNNASNKLESGSKKVAVANGNTVTVTVYVNKSASYNGNQPRLIQKRNDAIGVSADTVIATASGGTGSWLTLSGTTAAVTDDGVVEFVVDCDGTAGTVSVDDWSIS